ncbi:Glucose dehydrogenase [FAD, quinone], partial [Gryllus bimaculatus]
MVGECCTDCVFQDTEFLQNTCGASFALFMGLVQFLLRSQCDIAEPCTRLGRDAGLLQPDAEFDFVVVGAGVAGPVVAARLSENPHWSVLLLEAGPEEPTATQVPGFAVSAVGTVLDWNYTTGMMYTRGHRSIFDSWAAAGNEGWGYDDVLPFFKMAEHNLDVDELDTELHGFQGPLTVSHFPDHPAMAESVVQAGVELGYRDGDLNGFNQTGINVAQMMVQDGLRGSTSRLYLRPASRRENLHLAVNAHVSKIVIDPDTGRATGVEYLLPNGETRRVRARKEVVLSAGAVASPQLLLLSGVGPAEELRAVGVPVVLDLPGVGRNLHNHVSVGVGFWADDADRETLTLESLAQFLRTHDGPLSSTGLTQVTGFLRSKYAPTDVPDLQMLTGVAPRRAVPPAQVFFDGYNAACSATGLPDECSDGSVGGCSTRRYIYARPTNILPRSVGALRLASADPLAQPLIDPRYLSEQRDVDVLVEGLKLMVELTRTSALQKWGFE